MPQGAVIGSLLFLIFIIDLPIKFSSKIILIADDSIVDRNIKMASDKCELQNDLDGVNSWDEAKRWR